MANVMKGDVSLLRKCIEILKRCSTDMQEVQTCMEKSYRDAGARWQDQLYVDTGKSLSEVSKTNGAIYNKTNEALSAMIVYYNKYIEVERIGDVERVADEKLRYRVTLNEGDFRVNMEKKTVTDLNAMADVIEKLKKYITATEGGLMELKRCNVLNVWDAKITKELQTELDKASKILAGQMENLRKQEKDLERRYQDLVILSELGI